MKDREDPVNAALFLHRVSAHARDCCRWHIAVCKLMLCVAEGGASQYIKLVLCVVAGTSQPVCSCLMLIYLAYCSMSAHAIYCCSWHIATCDLMLYVTAADTSQYASSCFVLLQVAHRKFMDGMWDRDIQPKLCAEIPKPAYRLSIRYDVPGMFFLGFVLRKTPSRENFSVLPSGYYFRKQVSWINK